MSDTSPSIRTRCKRWNKAFRDITTATSERTATVGVVPDSGIGNNAPTIDFINERAISSALVLANLNSLPFDWVTRFSVGGVHMSVYIVKQLPVLPPETYLDASPCGIPWFQLIIPRVVKFTFTSWELKGFAQDLGYTGPPFQWNDERRHGLRSELDAIFAHMYGLDRSEVEWILDPPSPSISFPTLKKHELEEFGDYRTQRLVLTAFDAFERGEEPHLLDTPSPQAQSMST